MSKRWKPKDGELYFFADGTGCGLRSSESKVLRFFWHNDLFDNVAYQYGNCFKTEEDAEAAAEKVKNLLLSLHEAQPTTDCNQPPKLTAAVFNHPDCPKWAKYAAVDRSGFACFFDEKPKCDNVQMWLRGEEGECFKPLMSHKFNVSDWQNSLIQRPENNTMPDWCKVGERVWSTSCKAYFKVNNINNLNVEGGDWCGNCYSCLLDNLRQARLRPYNEEEMKALVGKIVEREGGRYLVTACPPSIGVCMGIGVNGDYYSAKRLLEEDFCIDNSPCGVLEHFESGEWVK